MSKLFICFLVFVIFIISSCEIVSYEEYEFRFNRRIIVYNSMTGDYILVVEGRCSAGKSSLRNQLIIVVKTGDKEYKRHTLYLTDNVSYFEEQLGNAEEGIYNYSVKYINFKE